MDAPTLTPAVIGRAENAHRPVLERILAGSGLERHGWIALALAAASPEAVPAPALRERLADALGVTAVEAGEALAQAERSGYLSRDATGAVSVTSAGSALRARATQRIDEVLRRAYGEVPAADLATAARVLALITERLATDPILQQG